MRIAIVNDLSLAVEILRRIVLDSAVHKVAWVAKTGAEAVRKCEEDTPDLILMDLFHAGYGRCGGNPADHVCNAMPHFGGHGHHGRPCGESL